MPRPKKLTLLLVLAALIIGTLATFVPLKSAYALTYPAPSWWNGDTCDSTHFNASGQTAHLLTTWNGIQVCGYGPTQGGTDVAVTFPGGHGEYEWECTELVKRYLYIVYGAPAIDAYGYNLVGNYTSTYSSLFTNVTNDGTHHIKVGDVLSYAEVVSGDHGHTAIVKDTSGLNGSGTGTITVIEQNADTSGQHTQTVTNWVIKHGIDDGGSTDTVSAWLTPNESWSDISPSSSTYDEITSMAASSTTSVWAGGYDQQQQIPVTYYHDTSWHKYSPSTVGTSNRLWGIATSSSGDTWTVGSTYVYPSTVTLAYHWNSSTHTWTHVTSDNPASNNLNELRGDAVDSSGNVYAVGRYYVSGSGYQPLIEKWNGTKFAQQTISLPSGKTYSDLYGVAFSSSSNGWAVGDVGNSSGYSWVIYHYDGSWSSYTIGSVKATLYSVAIVSDSEAWAVGTKWNSSTSTWVPLILHYNTSGWSEDTSFNGYYPNSATLNSVGTDGSSDVWVVGYWYNSSTSKFVPYTMHYNGYYWAQFDTPSPAGSASLQGVAVNSGDVWAGGYNGTPPTPNQPTPLVYQYS